MAIIFESTNRIIIPRWREFGAGIIEDEHFSIHKQRFSRPFLQNPFFRRRIFEWESKPTLENAWDLVNSAFVLDEFAVAESAAKFLKSNLSSISPGMRKVINKILLEPEIEVFVPEESSDREVIVERLSQTIREKLKNIRLQLSRQPRNEFYWMELARLYSIQGNRERAKRCVQVALQLSEYLNRYLLRTASRFYYHIGDYEQAQRTIRLSPYLSSDPWLMSAEISYATKMGRHSKLTKKGIDLINSDHLPAASLTELAGMIGTVELKNGAARSAKKYALKSLMAPNENSLAQLEWMSRQVEDIPVAPWLKTMEAAHEAKAFGLLYSGRFTNAVKQGTEWFLDQPFSKRPVHFVSYLCTVIAPNFQLAVDVCQFGIKSNPEDFTITNNLTFALAAMGKIKEASARVRDLNAIATDDRKIIIAKATEAFLFFKSKNPAEGNLKYSEAIEMARDKKQNDLANLAEAYLLREQYLAGEIAYEKCRQILKVRFDVERKVEVAIQLAAISDSITENRQR